MAERAGPRADERIRIDVALLEDLQRRQELAAEERLAASEARQCRQRRDDAALAEGASIIAFDAPDRHHRLGVDPEGGFDAGERVAPLGQHRATVGDALFIDQARHVIPDRGAEFGLMVE